MTSSVTCLQLAKRMLDLLGGVKEGEVLELSMLRDNSVLLRRADVTST